MRPAPKARTGPWRRDSPCPREISGLYVTAWSEVRVLPPEPIPEHQGSSGALVPLTRRQNLCSIGFVLVCMTCGANFPVELRFNGRRCDLRGRKQCLDCRPHRPLRKPRKPVARKLRALICVACAREFPAKMVIDGKVRSLYRRSFCLECSRFGDHNTSKVPLGLRATEAAITARA